jgi:peptidyl-dipeptidase Dcp
MGIIQWIFLVFLLAQCSVMSQKEETNPLLEPWSGKYQGVPPFDQIKPHHFEPALTKAMNEVLRRVDQVTDQTLPATFANTLVPLEMELENFYQTLAMYQLWMSSLNLGPELKALEAKMSPQLAAYKDQLLQNRALFLRIKSVKEKEFSQLNSEQQRLIDFHLTQMTKAGAGLSDGQKRQVSSINKKLAELMVAFKQNLLKDESERFVYIKDSSRLAGLPESFVASAKSEAKERGLDGWVIANNRSSMEPFLTYAQDRGLRKQAFQLWTSRGESPANDNNAVIKEIVSLRHQRSKIFGFETYAHWQLQDRMAQTPDQALDLMKQVWSPARQQVKIDLAEMQKLIQTEGHGFSLAPWDYRYYAEKLRKEKYAFDMDQVKPFLQMDHLRQAMFWAAGQMFGFEFEPATDVPVFHKDVTVYQVSREGEVIGLFYLDPFQRKGKRSGAWMTSYRNQGQLGGVKTLPLISNNSNFIKAESGDKTLLSWEDARTFFHEFGHALHGLASTVTYPSLSGAHVAVDFVELPSQFFEHLIYEPQVLAFLKNSQGQPFPQDLLHKIKKAAHFNQGFTTLEYLGSAMVDMKLHMQKSAIKDPRDFERMALAHLGMPSEIVMRHRLPQFSHLFASEYYSAAYYSYLWADVLSRDAYSFFVKKGGVLNPSTAQNFYKDILSVGNTTEPSRAFKSFVGRPPKVEALLKAKGFVSPEANVRR